MPRLDKKRQEQLEPKRMAYAKSEIEKLGFSVTVRSASLLAFNFKGHCVLYYPYSGWASGASIKDGRGLYELIAQLCL